MDNTTSKETNNNIASSGSASTIDNRSKEISKKVWDLESVKPALLSVKSNGKLPLKTEMRMKNNEFQITDYIDKATNERTAYLKIGNSVKQFKLKQENL